MTRLLWRGYDWLGTHLHCCGVGVGCGCIVLPVVAASITGGTILTIHYL